MMDVYSTAIDTLRWGSTSYIPPQCSTSNSIL